MKVINIYLFILYKDINDKALLIPLPTNMDRLVALLPFHPPEAT
jgi:hypothetical protein